MEWLPKSEPKVTYKPSRLIMHTHVLQLPNVVLRLQIVNMNGSIFIWIGDNESQMNDLSLAMPSRFTDESTATKIMGEKSNLTSVTLSEQLSKKLKKMVYVSYNFDDQSITLHVTKYLSELIITHPAHFQ